MTVAVDRLHRTVNDRPDLSKANVVKRIVLISNFLDAAKDDPDDTFGSILVERMNEKGVRMEVRCRLCQEPLLLLMMHEHCMHILMQMPLISGHFCGCAPV